MSGARFNSARRQWQGVPRLQLRSNVRGPWHNHPRIVQALHESGETLIHSHMSMFNDREIILAARLAEISPEGMNRSMFLTSGSVSNEAAMAIAKRYTGGYEIASPAVSFHGMNGLHSRRHILWLARGLRTYAPGHYPIIAPYRYRCRFCQDRAACDYSCLDTSFELLDAQADGPLAAVITEPLFSAGGVIDLPPGWLAELKRRCEAQGSAADRRRGPDGPGQAGHDVGIRAGGSCTGHLHYFKALRGRSGHQRRNYHRRNRGEGIRIGPGSRSFPFQRPNAVSRGNR